MIIKTTIKQTTKTQ